MDFSKIKFPQKETTIIYRYQDECGQTRTTTVTIPIAHYEFELLDQVHNAQINLNSVHEDIPFVIPSIAKLIQSCFLQPASPVNTRLHLLKNTINLSRYIKDLVENHNKELNNSLASEKLNCLSNALCNFTTVVSFPLPKLRYLN